MSNFKTHSLIPALNEIAEASEKHGQAFNFEIVNGKLKVNRKRHLWVKKYRLSVRFFSYRNEDRKQKNLLSEVFFYSKELSGTHLHQEWAEFGKNMELSTTVWASGCTVWASGFYRLSVRAYRLSVRFFTVWASGFYRLSVRFLPSERPVRYLFTLFKINNLASLSTCAKGC